MFYLVRWLDTQSNVPEERTEGGLLGADGIALASGEFIASGQIKSYQPRKNGAVVRTSDGRSLGIVGDPSGVLQHLAAMRPGPGDRIAESFFARSGAPVTEWLARVRTLREGDAYRGGVDPERARVVLEDPTADPTARAGAAAYLLPSMGEADRARVRVLAEATAHPRVRVALETAAQAGAEEELVRVLDEERQ
jgi:hypothetical protein